MGQKVARSSFRSVSDINLTEMNSSTVNNKETLSPWRRDVTVWRREANCSNVRIKGSGHLIAQTLPNALGKFFLLHSS